MDRVEHEPPAAPAAGQKARLNRGVVLIVGADESMRALVLRMLARRGFAALEASDTDEADAWMRSHGDTIAGAVLDLGIPARIADEIFACLRLARPNLPILFTGGYGEERLVARLAGSADTAFLPKPFGLDALGEKADDLFVTS